MTDEDVAAWREQCQAFADANRERGQLSPVGKTIALTLGALLLGGLAIGLAAANSPDKDCKRVPGGQGQTLNVCVDSEGNISDGDR